MYDLNEQLNFHDRRFSSIDPDDNFYNCVFDSLDQSRQSEYYTVDRFNLLTDDSSALTLLNFNIRSFNANGDSFLSMLGTLKDDPDIIVLTETWLDDKSKSFCNLLGYHSFHTVRGTGRGGGVSIFCKELLSSSPLNHLCLCNETIETCVVRVKLAHFDVIIFGIYRPHSDTIYEFTASVAELLNDNVVSDKNLLLTGDFNVNLLAQDSNVVVDFVSTMHSLHFLPTITKPTRFPPDDQHCVPSLLDHIWINMVSRYRCGILSIDISDHCPTFIKLFNFSSPSQKIKLSFRSHNPENIAKFYDQLSRLNWSFSDFVSVSQQVNEFICRVNSLYSQCFPLKVKYISAKRINSPWLSSYIMKLIKNKSLYFKYYKLNLITRQENQAMSNFVLSQIRQAKLNYYNECFNNTRGDIKQMWKHIKKYFTPMAPINI